MKRRQRSWYVTSKEDAQAMEAKGFAVKFDGQWRVLCALRDFAKINPEKQEDVS